MSRRRAGSLFHNRMLAAALHWRQAAPLTAARYSFPGL